jgi:hypothetical protein
MNLIEMEGHNRTTYKISYSVKENEVDGTTLVNSDKMENAEENFLKD